MNAKANADIQIKTLVESISIKDKLLEIQKRVSGTVGFDSVNPHFKNKYASLETVLEKILPVANEVGLVITQKIGWVDGFWCVRTLVMDNSSIEELSCMPVINPKGDAQGFGSALSYAKRYSLMSAFAMVGGLEDDDAETASGRPTGQKIPTKAIDPTYQATDYDKRRLGDMMKMAGVTAIPEMQDIAKKCMGKSWDICETILDEIITRKGV
jgi:hypothetical protein